MQCHDKDYTLDYNNRKSLISLEYMLDMAKTNELPFVPAYFGKWWGSNAKTKKQEDVDIFR